MEVTTYLLCKEREYVSRFQSTDGLSDEEVDKLFDYYAEKETER